MPRVSREHIDHAEIVRFAQDRVNLPKAKADEHRAQARRLGDKIEECLEKDPDFSLRRMMLSGSLAKGTALRTLNDIDLACYISGADAPADVADLLDYLSERLSTAFPNFSPDQIEPKTYSVTVSFRGSGLDVDVVPILYDGDPKWYGRLVSQEDGTYLETCVPRHLEFMNRRKEQEENFAQVVRLIKFWVQNIKDHQDGFKFKSFMIELILAHLLDRGCDFSDYPEAMQNFFTYIARDELRETIRFSDFGEQEIDAANARITIIDPVNEKNNVAMLYQNDDAEKIVDESLSAGDAIDYALRATTKQDTIKAWQKVFGPSFHG